MTQIRLVLMLSALFATNLSIAQAAPTPPHVYVAASGSDAGQCKLKSPCRSIARALKMFSTRGTVTIIEDGDYASFSIPASLESSKPNAITVEAAPGVSAHIRDDVTTLINIGAGGKNAGSQDEVVLRGLHIDAGNSIGISCTGIRVLYIESCFISGFSAGISFNARGRLFLKDTMLRENAKAVVVGSVNGSAIILIDHCRLEDNGTTGLDIHSGADVFMRDSIIANSARYGVNCSAETENKPASLFMENSSITGGAYNCVGLCEDGIGVHVGVGSGVATVRLSNSTITQNKTGVQVEQNGSVFSYKNNRISGNATDVSGTLNDADYR